MDLDLNQEPMDQTSSSTAVVAFDSVLEELEAAEENIRNRIVHLEAITSRARQRQRLPRVQTPIQITNFTGEAAAADGVQGEERRVEVEQNVVEERVVESVKGGKRKSAHLVAKALGIEEIDDGKTEESSGNFFDCNICLDIARDPVLTCCGHLFCWPCFYQLSYAYSKAKECPVCKGEVTESGIIPIYGNGNGGGDRQMEMKEAGLRVPPRPKAPRVESLRQKLISRGASSSSIVQSLRRFHNRIGGFGEQVQLESSNTTADRNNGFKVAGARSFFIFDAFNSIKFGNGHGIGGSREQNPRAVNRSSTFSVAATNGSESHAPDVVAVTNSADAATSVSPLSSNVDNIAAIGSETQTTDRNVQISPPDPSSSNGRRRNGISAQVSNEPTRRRLR
ncbi:RING-type E3 ubiquitin transferase [Trifolium repens]|nr:RING-type E3 ubiquitin transferase [Trifolium repens]